MLNEEEPITLDGSLIPLNLDPPGGEFSTYLSLSLSFFSIIPFRCVTFRMTGAFVTFISNYNVARHRIPQ
jgi:hypothetical protein